MTELESYVFDTLRIVSAMYYSGFWEAFLEKCGGMEMEDYFELTWEAIACIFKGTSSYWNEEKGTEALVITDPLFEELDALCRRYEQERGISEEENGYRRDFERDVNGCFCLESYDYDWRVYSGRHGRCRLVFLSGEEFGGLHELPEALLDVYASLEICVKRLREELGESKIVPFPDSKPREEAA